MIYEYVCRDCGHVTEAYRKVADREDTPKCEVCESENTEFVISICGGFKVPGAHNPNFQPRGGKGKYLFGEPVGPADPRSKAYQKQRDDENSTHYGPGQTAGMTNSEYKQFASRRDGEFKN